MKKQRKNLIRNNVWVNAAKTSWNPTVTCGRRFELSNIHGLLHKYIYFKYHTRKNEPYRLRNNVTTAFRNIVKTSSQTVLHSLKGKIHVINLQTTSKAFSEAVFKRLKGHITQNVVSAVELRRLNEV